MLQNFTTQCSFPKNQLLTRRKAFEVMENISLRLMSLFNDTHGNSNFVEALRRVCENTWQSWNYAHELFAIQNRLSVTVGGNSMRSPSSSWASYQFAFTDYTEGHTIGEALMFPSGGISVARLTPLGWGIVDGAFQSFSAQDSKIALTTSICFTARSSPPTSA